MFIGKAAERGDAVASLIEANAVQWTNRQVSLPNYQCVSTLGTVLFFLIFADDLDFQGRYISSTYGAFGIPQDIELTIGSMFLMGLIVYTISAVAFPIWYIALGENIGWKGYMLPLLCRKMSVKCAVIINGV